MKKLFVLLLLLLFSLSASAKNMDMEINPETITLDLIAGDITTKNITVIWTGDEPVECCINTVIRPDDTGIDVFYSNNSFIAMPEREYNIEMFVKTDISLMPDTYTIDTIFFQCNKKEIIILERHQDLHIFTYIPVFLLMLYLICIIWFLRKQKKYMDRKIEEIEEVEK